MTALEDLITMNLQTHDRSLSLRYLNAFGLWALEAVLIYALYDQLFTHDLPCPLCLLQRVGFAACMIALLLSVTFSQWSGSGSKFGRRYRGHD